MSSFQQRLRFRLQNSALGPVARRVKARMVRGEHRLLFFFGDSANEWPGLGQQLYETEPVFRESIERCSSAVEKHLGIGMVSEFSTGTTRKPLSHDGQWSVGEGHHVALAALQIALYELWRSRDIVPDGIVSMGSGECVAAYAGGALTLEDTMKVACAWEELASSPKFAGQLLFLNCDYQTIKRLGQQAPVAIDIVGQFSPLCTVVWIAESDFSEMKKFLESENVTYHSQSQQWTYHTSHVSSQRKRLEAELANIEPQELSVPLYSAMMGSRVPQETRMDGLFWYGVLRQQCRLREALQSAKRDGHDILLNIGPPATAAPWLEQNGQDMGQPLMVLDSMQRDRPEKTALERTEKALRARGFGAGKQQVGAAVERDFPIHAGVGRTFPQPTQEFLRDPYPYYEKLRQDGTIHHFENEGFYLILASDNILEILRQPDQFAPFPFMGYAPVLDHMYVRQAGASYFSLDRVQRTADYARTISREQLQQLRGRGDIEVVSEFALPVSAKILGHFLGIGGDKLDVLCDHTIRLRHEEGKVFECLRDFFSDYAKEVRENPGDNFCSQLIAGSGDEFSPEDISIILFIVWLTGVHAVSNFVPEAIFLLASNSEVRDRVQADSALIAPFVEEALRLSSLAHNLLRVAQETTTVSGMAIPANALVKLGIGAANRDPARWPNPHQISLDRDTRGILTFGYGVHRCVGAALARVEAQAALHALLEQMPNFRAAEPLCAVHWNPSIDSRSLESFLIAAD